MKKTDIKLQRRYSVFVDFDNTIAKCDTFDGLLPKFSRDDKWISIEESWKQGKIGSLECLSGQLAGMDLTKKDLDNYLLGIELDPYFKKLAEFLSYKKNKVTILTDNFDYILKSVLKNNKINNVKVYSNKLVFSKGRPSPSFPFKDKKCHICAHCKKKNLLANTLKDSIIVYIGDGQSDICPAKYADIVFAKDGLLKHFKEKKLEYRPFRNLKEVYSYFKGVL
ncbi:MAG: MtnX-like HAD-IB family phosphatase [Candidatus Omnitrophica bacterium]|nr:MtnX-like HAD-IB family phosphatase [Candidatus Omnitrophota bacterium]